ncbi:MAG: malate dehydrogenase [Spongiibacteraceae bacterium]|nr:malate dehydrogenase [Spongiibacteraceae bacterium]
MVRSKNTVTSPISDEEALHYHAKGKPGKVAMSVTKALNTARDLSLAYSPGVAVPCVEIQRDSELAYDYTSKGNLVAVITNGSAVLGLGDLKAIAAKPVMEGKSVLFKRFGDIDSVDIEVDTNDPQKFIDCVSLIGCTFGGINLEDIKAPGCFIIEDALQEALDIPVFHDDQHGTAIVCGAGLLNAIELTGRKAEDVRLVVNGAGSAAIRCVEMAKGLGVREENVVLVDSSGVIYKGREKGMNQWKALHAAETPMRTLEEVMVGADVFFGLSVEGAVNSQMVASMAEQPIIFAMANPNPEITPEQVHSVRSDAIVATGRSDYPNQINNVLAFPYIFRGALDVRASTVNLAMKLAAAQALAELAREDVPVEIADRFYPGQTLEFGQDYVIPVPFDPRLLPRVSFAVAMAAMESGVAQRPIQDLDVYQNELQLRADDVIAV